MSGTLKPVIKTSIATTGLLLAANPLRSDRPAIIDSIDNTQNSIILWRIFYT